MKLLRRQAGYQKIIAAAGAAPGDILATSGLEPFQATCLPYPRICQRFQDTRTTLQHDHGVVVSNNYITSQGFKSSYEFALTICKQLGCDKDLIAATARKFNMDTPSRPWIDSVFLQVANKKRLLIDPDEHDIIVENSQRKNGSDQNAIPHTPPNLLRNTEIAKLRWASDSRVESFKYAENAVPVPQDPEAFSSNSTYFITGEPDSLNFRNKVLPVLKRLRWNVREVDNTSFYIPPPAVQDNMSQEEYGILNVDYFSSIRLLLQFLETDSAWRDRREIQAALNRYVDGQEDSPLSFGPPTKSKKPS